MAEEGLAPPQGGRRGFIISQENGSLSVTKGGEKVRVTGVCRAYGTLFVVDETVKPGDPILLETR